MCTVRLVRISCYYSNSNIPAWVLKARTTARAAVVKNDTTAWLDAQM